jgi:hypothetical protein
MARVLLAVAMTLVANIGAAESIGRASMPSRLAQYLGYGYGAGHHAPMVRTPGQHPQHVPRNVRVPRSSGPLYPAAYAPVGCYGEACYPAPAPQLAPPPAIVPVDDRQARYFPMP